MNDITFSKEGELYVSNPIFGNGNSVVKYQVGFKVAGARFLVEQSYSPTFGWELFIDKVTPQIPNYVVGAQNIPNGMYVRFRSTAEPCDVKVDVVAEGGGGGNPQEITNKIDEIDKSKYGLKVVEELPPISDAKENVIYSVKNSGLEDGNVRDEYVLIDGKFERLGSETFSVDDNEIDALFKK